MKVVAVIPAYNEESTIADIVKRTLKYVDTVIVVDNNSTDLTRFKAKDAGAYLVMEYKQGAGAATRRGIRFAQRLNPDVIVTLDGDGQHIPEYIPNLLEQFYWLDAPDIVIGSRFYGESRQSIPMYRKFGINVITWLYNGGNKSEVFDSQCCFRAFNNYALNSIMIKENGFGFSAEMLVKARKLKLRISEVPIPCVYHKDLKQNSTLNPIRHGLEVAFKTIYWRLKLWN